MFLDHFPDHFSATLGEGVYFSPNGCKGRRLKENISSVNAIFADFDFKPKAVTGDNKPEFKQFMLDLDDLPTPTFIVESGNGWHVYWCLEKPIAVNETNRIELTDTVEGIHRYLSSEYGSDSGAVDVLHLLRKPGFEHRKMPDYPVMVEVVVNNEDTKYTLDELTKAMPPLVKDSTPPVEDGQSSGDDFDIKQVVIDVWAEQGDEVSFDESGRMIWNGEQTATFIGRKDNCNYVATTSEAFPYKGNATTYVAGVKGISTKKAYRWLIDKYGERVVTAPKTEAVDDIDMGGLMHVVKNKGGDNEYIEYLANDENIIRIFNHYKVAKYDNFMNRAFVRIGDDWKIRDDGSDGEMYSWLVEKFPFLAKITVRRVGELLTFVQYRNKFDSAQDYINSLHWDGVGRLDTWLSSVFYVEPDSYHKDIGSKWFMGLVARTLKPGCKFDNALIVHGGQDIGKSSVFLTIAGEDRHIEFTDLKVREMQQDMQGKMIVEFAEAAIFSKADSESLKSIVTRQTDTFRVPYERHARDFPRRCVFAVTANNDDILKDSTGARRWWVVDVPDDMKVYPAKRHANVEWLRENRDQLFAEAATRVRNGDEYHKVDQYELIRRQKSITATEQDEDLFYSWYHCLSSVEQNAGMTVREAYCKAYKEDRYGNTLREDTVSISKSDEMRVSRILKKLGLEKKKSNGHVLWVPGEMFDRDFTVKMPTTRHEKHPYLGENF